MTTQHDERRELIESIRRIQSLMIGSMLFNSDDVATLSKSAALLAADGQAGGEVVACWGKRSAIDGKIYESSRCYGDGFDVPLYTHPQPQAQYGYDWSLLEATQESLREHMAMVAAKDAEIAKLHEVADVALEALEDLHGQVRHFCETQGEADFETGLAVAAITKIKEARG